MKDDVFTIHQADGITVVAFTGNPGKQDLLEAYQKLADLPQSSLRLWDFRKSELLLPTNDVRAFAEHINATSPKFARVAIVVSSEISYGISRVLMALRDLGEVKLDVFREYEQAAEWLKQAGECR